jgi:membrane fusion protein (multidrug efflux system)
MNPLVFAMRRPIRTLMLLAALTGGGVFALNKAELINVPLLNSPKTYAFLDYVGTHANQIKGYVVEKFQSYFQKKEEEHEETRKLVVTSPVEMDVTITQQFVCQIHSQRHIDVCALDSGYLEEIAIREGQAVKKGDVMFKILPVLYKAKADAEVAEALVAEREYNNTKQLFETKKIVSENEVLLFEARRDKAKAKAEMAKAELNFTKIVAPFDGIVDRQRQQLGSLIKEGEILTTLSDNRLMWVYFNVPEARYLEYMSARKEHEAEDRIELLLASGETFPQPGKIGAIEGQFNNETGNIAFRADFPNPDGLLRHGQTGTILIHRTLKNALVIPQRATFEILDKRYVKIVGEDGVADQRLITVKHELDDIFVIDRKVDVKEKIGLEVNDKIVLEGVREVEVGAKVEYEFRKPDEALKNQKFHAE